MFSGVYIIKIVSVVDWSWGSVVGIRQVSKACWVAGNSVFSHVACGRHGFLFATACELGFLAARRMATV